MKKTALKLLKNHSDRLPQRIFWPNELAQFASQGMGHGQCSYRRDFRTLLQQKLVVKAEFISNRYDAIVRYLRGEHSVEELALSLQRNSFLSHGTALTVHGIAPLGKIICEPRTIS